MTRCYTHKCIPVHPGPSNPDTRMHPHTRRVHHTMHRPTTAVLLLPLYAAALFPLLRRRRRLVCLGRDAIEQLLDLADHRRAASWGTSEMVAAFVHLGIHACDRLGSKLMRPSSSARTSGLMTHGAGKHYCSTSCKPIAACAAHACFTHVLRHGSLSSVTRPAWLACRQRWLHMQPHAMGKATCINTHASQAPTGRCSAPSRERPA